MRPLLSVFVVLSACAVEDTVAPDVSLEGTASLAHDKYLASPDEVAAIVRTRATLDAGIDLHTMLGMFGPEDDATSLALACRSELSVVWRETGCAGLHGWGLEYTIEPCEATGIMSGTVFWSYAEVLAGLPPELDPAEVIVQMEAMAGPPRPDRVMTFAAEFQGIAGGQLNVCATAAGDLDQQLVNEVVDVDLDVHESRMIFDTQMSRHGAGADVTEVKDGTVQAQFPRGALVDPYRLDVFGFTRPADQALAIEGELRQHGWNGDLEARLTDAAEEGLLYVDGARGPQMAEIPEF